VKTLLDLLVKLLSLWEQYKADKKAAKRAEELDKLRKDPNDWFNDHFDGVRNVSAKADNADKTSAKPD